MNQQQNKHSTKNHKKNRLPAKLLCVEYIALTNTGEIKATYNTEEELIKFMQMNKTTNAYILKTYTINNKKIQTKERK